MSDRDLLNEWYASFGAFVKNHDGVYLSELEYYTRTLNMYAVYEQPHFEEIKVAVEKIQVALPSINRIFAKPIIHLIERDEILPVESVRYLNNKAVEHVSSHSELWANLEEDGIRPRKLLSRTYSDNYSIYENIVFANTVDLVLDFIRKKVKLLEDLMFSQKLHNVNVLDRTNHIDYYLVLSKLYTGYIRNFSRYAEEATRLKEVLIKFYQVLSGRLYKKVYQSNKNKRIAKLHKTNILSMDKDYRKIYSLYRFFDGCKAEERAGQISFNELNYFWYCELMTLFATQHFGFTEDKRQVLRFGSLDVNVAAKNYALSIRTVGEKEDRGIMLTFWSERPYAILLVPLCKYVKNPKVLCDFGADEVVYLSPVPSDQTRLVGINELDSVRRLQQILLKGMVMSSIGFEVCPFCLGTMRKEEGKERFVCDGCKQVVERLICPETGLNYYHTYIDRFIRPKHPNEIDVAETRMNFRNINRLTENGYICPCCRKQH